MRGLEAVLIKSMVILSKDLVRIRKELMQHMEELRTASLTFDEPTSIKEAYHEKISIWCDDDDYSVDN